MHLQDFLWKKLPLKSRSLQWCTCAHFIFCKYACFYWDTHMSVIAEEARVSGSWQFRWAHFFSLLCYLPGDLNSEADVQSFLSSCWDLQTSVSQRVSGFLSLSPASKISPHCIWSWEDKNIMSVWYHDTVVLGVTKIPTILPVISKGLLGM